MEEETSLTNQERGVKRGDGERQPKKEGCLETHQVTKQSKGHGHSALPYASKRTCCVEGLECAGKRRTQWRGPAWEQKSCCNQGCCAPALRYKKGDRTSEQEPCKGGGGGEKKRKKKREGGREEGGNAPVGQAGGERRPEDQAHH